MPDGLTSWPTDSAGQAGFGVRNGTVFNYWQSNGHGHAGVTLYDASGNALFSKTPSDARTTPTDAADVIASLVAYNGTTEDRLRVDANKNLLVSLGSLIAGEDQANSRLDMEIANSFGHIAAGQATTVLKAAPGWLYGFVLNSKATASSVMTIYDNTSGTGTVLAIPDCVTAAAGQNFMYCVRFTTGLTIVTATANSGDMTFSFR